MECHFLPSSCQKWQDLAEKLGDIYFLPLYVEANKYIYEEGTQAGLFLLHDKDIYVWAPYLKRPIPQSIYYDLTSPYGYTGLVVTTEDGEFLNYPENKGIWRKYLPLYLQNLNKFCKKNNIVTEFTRFHPILENHLGFLEEKNNSSLLVFSGKGVLKDLKKDEVFLFQEMKDSWKRNIKTAKKNKLEVKFASGKVLWDYFWPLYLETLERIKAKEFYKFSSSFFDFLLTKLASSTTIGITFSYEKKPIAGALFLHYKKNFYYFLGGSAKEGLIYRPNNLLFWEAAIYAKNKGYHYFYLGEGYRGEDELYRFKSGFSPKRKEYFTYRKIHLNSVYRLFSNEPIEAGFFPSYRSPH